MSPAPLLFGAFADDVTGELELVAMLAADALCLKPGKLGPDDVMGTMLDAMQTGKRADAL